MLAGVAALVALTDTPLCPTAFFLGVPCPGCGLTRATLALLRGDVHGAMHFHPLVFVLTPLFGVALGTALVEYVRGPHAHASLPPAWWTGRTGLVLASALLVLVVGVWALRFAGFFGGPVPVESYSTWHARVAS
ncbi:MAG TPA: DUF2752 domain-containing protein [Polyangiaceae bacterium]|nr:DUF2752 domain-containing protein [Polyangiaceae bacterium]